MTQTDGEKELILGNKQLISLFFVVVALCGVFFAMGYMIGRNISKPVGAGPDAGSPPAVISPASPSPAQDAEPPRETGSEDTSPSSPTPAESAPPVEAATASAPQAPQKPDPPTQTQAAHDTPAAPESGAIWLQVTALRRVDADNLVKTLREQNFPAVLADSSRPDLFRVLVGPYHQTADVAEAKTRLKSLGFANSFVQK